VTSRAKADRPRLRPPIERAFMWGFIGVGVATLVMVVVVWNQTAAFARRAVQTTGVVVRFDPKYPPPPRARRYRPIVLFRTSAGVEVEFRHEIGRKPPAYEVGEVVPVWYDPPRPASARIVHSWWSLYGVPVLFVGVGALFVALGAWAVPALIRLGARR
jgi:hypothetical protein